MVQRAALGLAAGALLCAGALAQVPEFALVSRDDSESRVGCDRSKWSGGAGRLYLAGAAPVIYDAASLPDLPNNGGPTLSSPVPGKPSSEACLAQWSPSAAGSAAAYDARPLFVLEDVSEVRALPGGGAILSGRMRTSVSSGDVMYVAKTSKALTGTVLPDWLATFPDAPLRVLLAQSTVTIVSSGSKWFQISNANGAKTELPMGGLVETLPRTQTFAVQGPRAGPSLFVQTSSSLTRIVGGKVETVGLFNGDGAWLYAPTSTTMFAYAVADGRLWGLTVAAATPLDAANLGTALLPGATAMGASPSGAYVATCTSTGSSPTRLAVRRLHLKTGLVASFSLAPIVFGTGYSQHKCDQDGLRVDDSGVVVLGAAETFARPMSFTSAAKLVRLASDPADASKLVLTHLSVANDVAIRDVAEIRGPAFLGNNLYAMFGARKTVVTFALPADVPAPLRTQGDVDLDGASGADGTGLSDISAPAPPAAGTSDAQTSPASAAWAAAAVLAVAGVVVVAAAVAYRRRRALAADATRGEIAADPAASL